MQEAQLRSESQLLSSSPAPFFVVGAQRSGTTMLRLMLNGHRRLAVPFETSFLRVEPAARELGPLSERSNQEKLAQALADERFTEKGEVLTDIEAVLARDIHDFGSFIDAVFTTWANSKGKARWGIKTPGYVVRMDEIVEHFPQAQFIHIVRDGRDVALSFSRISWGPSNVMDIAKDWQMKVMLGRKMGRVLGPGRYLEIRYENLVREPEPELRNICEFLGEEFDPDMLSYHKNAKSEMPDSSMQWHKSSVSAPNQDKVLAWKRELPVSDQILFEQYAGDTLELFGYERTNRGHTLMSKLKQLYFAIK